MGDEPPLGRGIARREFSTSYSPLRALTENRPLESVSTAGGPGSSACLRPLGRRILLDGYLPEAFRSYLNYLRCQTYD